MAGAGRERKPDSANGFLPLKQKPSPGSKAQPAGGSGSVSESGEPPSRNAAGSTEAAAAAARSFEGALRRLEEIARHLEEGDLDLQASLALYREARELHGYCVARLSEAEQELQILLADDRLVPESRAPSAGPRDEG